MPSEREYECKNCDEPGYFDVLMQMNLHTNGRRYCRKYSNEVAEPKETTLCQK